MPWYITDTEWQDRNLNVNKLIQQKLLLSRHGIAAWFGTIYLYPFSSSHCLVTYATSSIPLVWILTMSKCYRFYRVLETDLLFHYYRIGMPTLRFKNRMLPRKKNIFITCSLWTVWIAVLRVGCWWMELIIFILSKSNNIISIRKRHKVTRNLRRNQRKQTTYFIRNSCDMICTNTKTFAHAMWRIIVNRFFNRARSRASLVNYIKEYRHLRALTSFLLSNSIGFGQRWRTWLNISRDVNHEQMTSSGHKSRDSLLDAGANGKIGPNAWDEIRIRAHWQFRWELSAFNYSQFGCNNRNEM